MLGRVCIDSLLANKLMGYLKIYPSCTLSEKSWVKSGRSIHPTLNGGAGGKKAGIPQIFIPPLFRGRKKKEQGRTPAL